MTVRLVVNCNGLSISKVRKYVVIYLGYNI
jgi:hypothetical protein